MYKLLFIFLLFYNFSFSQENECSGHMHHHHDEIGISNGIVYNFSEKEIAYGLHVHFVKNIKHTIFGLGIGYEKIFDEHNHNNVSLILQFRPINRLTFNLGPGINIETINEIHPALHIETSYDFCLKNFHIGPVIEYSISTEDKHISFGLHIGKGF